MRRLAMAGVFAMLVVSCGGASDTGGDASDSPGNNATGTVDPCSLADEEMLADFFAETPEPETSENGPILGCSWTDANANSLLIQTASDFDLRRPDPCEGCLDLTFADDGYASESLFQSGASFVVGSNWFSVTTTGFGNDVDSMASLAESIYENSNS